MLTGRLKPVMDRLQLRSENVSWDALISQVIHSTIFFAWLCCICWKLQALLMEDRITAEGSGRRGPALDLL
jgi:hypothetical protein